MFMTVLSVLFVGSFAAIAALGHLLLLNALVFGKADRAVALDKRPASVRKVLHAAH